MSDAVRFPLVLGLIALVSAAGLAITYSATRDQILFQERLEKERAVAQVLRIDIAPEQLNDPTAERPWTATPYPPASKKDEGFTVYQATDPKTEERLYAAEGRMQGYSSKVRVIAAVDQAIEKDPGAATVRAVKVVSQVETPGLGSHSSDAEFQRQFQDLPVQLLAVDKTAGGYREPGAPGSDSQRVAAITGATITTNAVIGAVRQALERIREHVERAGEAGP
jgi:electron transport complex protein RnfG